MDERLKTIADNFDQMKIGLDTPFQFRCTECGKCCIHREDILLSPKDLFRAAKELKMPILSFFQTYCECYPGKDSRVPIVRLLPRGSVRRCPLLKDRHCMIHKAKPAVCAMFPVGRGVAVPKDADESTSFTVQYILQPPECGDRSETHTVREWLASFGMEAEDPDFVLWQRFIIHASSKLRALEKKLLPDAMVQLWKLVTFGAYFNYEITEEFRPQFETNLSDVKNILQAYEQAVSEVKPNAG